MRPIRFCMNGFRRFVRFGSRCGLCIRKPRWGRSGFLFSRLETARGRLLISRCDDDDILPIDFVQLTRQCGDAVKQRNVLLEWPHGYVWHQGRLHRFTNRWNQFSSLVTDLNVTPHDWIPNASKGVAEITVNNSKGWCWVRHGDVASYTKPKYLRQSAGNVQLERWPVDIRNRRLLDAVKSLEDQYARQ